MSGVEAVVTEVLRAHPDVIEYGGWNEHPCCAEAEDHTAHVAALIVQALGLTEERATIPEWYETGEMVENRCVQGPPTVPERSVRFIESVRWVSPWVAVERGEQPT